MWLWPGLPGCLIITYFKPCLKIGTEILGHVFGWLHTRDKRRKLRRQKEKKSLVHSKMTVHSSGLARLNIYDLLYGDKLSNVLRGFFPQF